MNDATTPRKDHLDTLAICLLLACCMFWGLQQILVKAIMDEVAPLFQASLRCIGASALLVVWCRLRGIRLFVRDGSLFAGLLAGGLFAAEFACI
jgi:drug/metabolite transporter (DMT)-like permease